MCGLSVLLHHGPSIFSTSVTAHEVENGSGPPVGSTHPADRRIAMQGLQMSVLCLLMAAGLAASASVLAQEANSPKILRVDSLLEDCEDEMGSYDNFGCIKFVWAFRLGVEEIAA